MRFIDLSSKYCVEPCADLFYTYVFGNEKEKEFVDALDCLLSNYATKTGCTEIIMENISVFRDYLFDDADVLASFDPAADTLDEVILCYPAAYALAVYRLANALYRNGVKVAARLLTECAHGKTGIDIHPGASIGKRFFLDHGTGVVIGETTIIHDNVSLYQGVTLGAKRVIKELKEVKRHPTIENNVIIYSHATILGGDTIIGRDSIINGNVFLTESIPPESIVYALHDIAIKSRKQGK